MTKSRIVQWLLAAFVCTLAASAAASFHNWRVNEIYSSADGTIQFVEFREAFGTDGENFLAEHMLTVTRGNQTHTFTFPDNLPSGATANRYFIVATPGFASLGIVTPDYVVPNGFLFVDGGTLQYGASGTGIYGIGPVDTVSYGALPTDGITSIDRIGGQHPNSPTNFAGSSGTIGMPQTVSPQNGWWWNPAENGRGFFIERQGGNLFFAAYLYATDGSPLWTISAGPLTSSSTYNGTLQTFTGGQTLTGPYRSPAAGPSLDTLTLQFFDARHGLLTWIGGSVPIERFDYAGLGSPAIASAPQNGWWWNAAESGRGFSLEVQGATLFVAGYMYDSTGFPVWYVSVGTLSAAGTYQGTWMQFANGQTITGAYRPPTLVNANAGALTVQFADAQNATLTLPDGRAIPLTRFRF